MFTYTMTNKENGTSITSQEMTKEMAEKMVAMGKKNDVNNQIEFSINIPEVAEEIQEKIEAIKADPEAKEGAEGLNIYNASATKKMEKLSWELYWLTSAQRTTPNAAPDTRLKNW